jgi:hypothetical protein
VVSRIEAGEERGRKDGVDMSWHYRVRKRVVDNEPVYGLVEYFPKARLDTSMSGPWWSEDDVAPTGFSRKELIQTLACMLEDAKRYKTFVEKET